MQPNILSEKTSTGFRLKHKIVEYGRNYLAHSNLHGCRYIVDKKYRTGISMCWLLVFITCLAFCFYLILLQLNRFQETAVLNSISTTGYPVWKNPFPAVTICNNNLVYKNKTKDITNALVAEGFSETDIIEFLSKLSYLVPCTDCNNVEVNINLKKQLAIENVIERIGYDIDKLMLELAHPCASMLKKCVWRSEEKPCSSFFKMIKTTMGYCCAFNYFGIEKYQKHYSKALFSGGFGVHSGLRVLIDIEPDQYILPASTSPAVTVLTKHGLQFAEFGSNSYSISAGDTMDVSVEVNIFKGDRDLKYLKDVTRSCWFRNEGNLKWSRMYNHLTCFNECKADYIFKICNCVPFYYAFKGDEKICTFKDFSCLIYNRSIFNNVLLTSNREEDNNFASTVQSTSGTRFCYCLPSCDDVLYILHKDKKVNMKLQNTTTCNLFVYFNNVSGILRLRTVHVTWDTLLAIIGGLFGLCMGGSVVTILELIFFLLQGVFRKSTINSKKDVTKQQKSFIF